MPAYSEKLDLLWFLEILVILATIQGNHEQVGQWAILYELVQSSRYVCRGVNNRKSLEFCVEHLFRLPDEDFRQTLRTTKAGFQQLSDLISSNCVFKNNSTCPQTAISIQLAVTLYRLGHCGNGASLGEVGRRFGIGKGTVLNFTDRVFKAILEHDDTWLKWPSPERRKEISECLKDEGFPGCVGFVDGTVVPLGQKPAVDGPFYFDRKRQYSINVQVICDIDKRVTACYIGLTGSSADTYVYDRMEISRNPEEYFSEGEYLIGDKGYRLTERMLVPYKAPASDTLDNTEFNFCIAKTRVQNEHCIGIVKGRFSSLKMLGVQLRGPSDKKRVTEWVYICFILHNMLADLGDVWEEKVDNDSPFRSDERFQGEAQNAKLFRERVKQQCLIINHANGRLPICSTEA